MKLLKSQTNTLKTDNVTITGMLKLRKFENIAFKGTLTESKECEEEYDKNKQLVTRRQKHKRVQEFKLTVPKSLGKLLTIKKTPRSHYFSTQHNAQTDGHIVNEPIESKNHYNCFVFK